MRLIKGIVVAFAILFTLCVFGALGGMDAGNLDFGAGMLYIISFICGAVMCFLAAVEIEDKEKTARRAATRKGGKGGKKNVYNSRTIKRKRRVPSGD